MNVPDWSSGMGGEAFAALTGGGDDDGFIELLWCNGHVVMQSQAPRKPPRPEKAAAAAVQDDEAAAWFQYPVEDSLERDLFSELFGDAQQAADAGSGRACKEEAECAEAAAAPRSGLMPPPREEKAACLGDLGAVSDGVAATAATEAGESSMLTIGSSFCGSNHVQTTPRARARAAPCDDRAPPPGAGGGGKAGGGRARDAATVTSSSMRPRSCTTTKAGHPSATAAHRSGKRKQSDATETEEFESADATCEPAQKLTTAKRRRAAEVHNLSERRRRDRINEKMKALQELIPHCNKTDKASMLDEAIEYLKSLQLQLQMMWMGGGMAAAAAPVMFPAGVHHQYMQRVAVAPPHVASMPRMPFMAPAALQSPPVADPYACYLAVDHLQPPPPHMHYLQGMGFYHQQQQSPALPPPPGRNIVTTSPGTKQNQIRCSRECDLAGVKICRRREGPLCSKIVSCSRTATCIPSMHDPSMSNSKAHRP